MPKNLTLAVPDELSEKMDQLKEVNWSAVARQAIEEYVERRQEPDLTPLLERLSKQKNEQYKKGLETATKIAYAESYAGLDEIFTKFAKEINRQFSQMRIDGIMSMPSTMHALGLANNPVTDEDKHRILGSICESLGVLNKDEHHTKEFLHGLYDGLMKLKNKLGV